MSLFLVVGDGDHGFLEEVGRGGGGPRLLVQRDGSGQVVGGGWERALLGWLRWQVGSFVIRTHSFLVAGV